MIDKISNDNDLSITVVPDNSKMELETSEVNVNDDNSFSRPPSSAQVGIDYNQQTSIGSLKFSNDVYGQYNSFVNSADAGTTNEEFSFQYGASTLILNKFSCLVIVSRLCFSKNTINLQ